MVAGAERNGLHFVIETGAFIWHAIGCALTGYSKNTSLRMIIRLSRFPFISHNPKHTETPLTSSVGLECWSKIENVPGGNVPNRSECETVRTGEAVKLNQIDLVTIFRGIYIYRHCWCRELFTTFSVWFSLHQDGVITHFNQLIQYCWCMSNSQMYCI